MAASRKKKAGGVQPDGGCQTASSTPPAAEMVKQMGVLEENRFHVKRLEWSSSRVKIKHSV
jgi:hypothetical protein